MNPNDDNKLELGSLNITEEKISQLKTIFPEVVTENKIDFDKLQVVLGGDVEVGKERYGMNWPGKANCFKIIQEASIGTLKPVRNDSVNFDNTENLFIEGDSLEVLKLLQKSYFGKIKMIYIDPPYNTGKDFIYPDNYSESLDTYLRYTRQKGESGLKLTTNVETEGRYHSKWINMMYPRLYLARNLLKEDGTIFISIDDHEVDNLKKICNEIFGEENFIAQLIWNTEGHTDNQYEVKVNHEYILLYCKNKDNTKLENIVDPNTREESNLWKGIAENSITKNGNANPPSEILLPTGFPSTIESLGLEANDPGDEFYTEVREQGFISRDLTEKYHVNYPVRKDKLEIRSYKLQKECRFFSGWANINKLKLFIENDFSPINDDDGSKLTFYLSENGVIYYRRERLDAKNILSVLRNVGTTEKMRSELEKLGILFKYPKPKQLIKHLIKISTKNDECILDFFAGSATTAHSVLELNVLDSGKRKFIMVQLQEPTEANSEARKSGFNNIAEIGKERIKRVISKLEGENPEIEKTALGFKLLRLEESNFKIWNKKSDKLLTEQLQLSINNISDDSSDEDILYEIILKAGYPLTVSVLKLEILGKIAYSIDSNSLLICLESDLTKELMKEIADFEPTKVICLDRGFDGNDELKTNVVELMKVKNVEFKTI